ncbi:MAG: chemotaxis protein CheB [bacterium]
MPDIKVLVAGANPVMRMRLVKAIRSNAGLRFIGEASDLPETYTRAEALEPDVVLIARELTLPGEFTLMKALFRALNSHWITIDHRSTGVANAGRPNAGNDGALPAIDTALPPDEICRQIIAAGRLEPRQIVPGNRVPLPVAALQPGKIILIGSSTGGVDALLAVLSALPADCPPVALVQHTGQSFSESLIRLLDRRCAVNVVAARDGMDIHPGLVCAAAGSPGHLRLKPGRPLRASLEAGPLISGHMPSVDALFRSAVPFASQVVAVLLTGMGRDGAEGLLDLRRAGAVTIGQDQATSVVYGMPRAAWELGAVQHQVGLGEIAATVLRACAVKSEERRVIS